MESSIRILAIVPSESIQAVAHDLVAKRNLPITLETRVANLFGGEKVAEQLASSYDVVLARGETAMMIQRTVKHTPVIKIPITIADVLSAIKLAENYQERFAVVGFSFVTSQAHLLRDVLQMDLDIYTLYQIEDAEPLMHDLRERGYRLVVSGMGIDHIARRTGLNSIQITTGQDSIGLALDQAITLSNCLKHQKERRRFFQELLQESPLGIMVFDASHSLVYSHLPNLDEKLAMNLAIRELQTSEATASEIQKTRGTDIITMYRRAIDGEQGSEYTAFYFQVRGQSYIPLKNEIRIFSKDRAIEVFLQHFPEHSPTNTVNREIMNHMLRSMTPVLILGERGTGKEQIAALLYVRGPLQTNPYYIVDFSLINDKAWNFLLTNTNSPLYESGKTIYFSNLDTLTPARVDRLKTQLFDSGLCQYNRILFSCVTSQDAPLPDSVRRLGDELGCQSLRLIPLRERVSELHTLFGLYISTANVFYAKQVIGLSKGSERLLMEYPWPGNLTQFRKVVFRLVELSSSSYISESLAKQILASESNEVALSSSLSSIIDTGKTLHEIERDIVKAVLEKMGGNQSKVAKQLGISRTTMWRMLQ